MNHLGDTNKMVGEDHIRDATKMVSDTPRTDENTFRAYTSPDNSSRSCVSASFARQLERELNAANDRIKRLEEALDTLTCVIGLTPIKGNLAALQEAFDMARTVLKAKEAKP